MILLGTDVRVSNECSVLSMKTLNSYAPFSFQKHEDESESWLHRQVCEQNVKSKSGVKSPAIDVQVFYLLLSTEWSAALFSGRTQVLLHQGNSPRWERKVFPHLHVNLNGNWWQNSAYCICILRLGTDYLVGRCVTLSQPNTSTDILQSLTSGDWDVTRILAYNHKRNLMWDICICSRVFLEPWLFCYSMVIFRCSSDTSWAQRTTPNDDTCTGTVTFC